MHAHQRSSPVRNPDRAHLVPLPTHDQVPRGHVPHLPRLVIAGGDEDGLGGVQRHAGHRQQVPLERLLQRHRLGVGRRKLHVCVRMARLRPRDRCPTAPAAAHAPRASRARCTGSHAWHAAWPPTAPHSAILWQQALRDAASAGRPARAAAQLAPLASAWRSALQC